MDEQENMDASRMMFDWDSQGMGPGFTQEQVDGEWSSHVPPGEYWRLLYNLKIDCFSLAESSFQPSEYFYVCHYWLGCVCVGWGGGGERFPFNMCT